MKKFFLPVLVIAQLIACGSDDKSNNASNNAGNRCGAGQQVEADGELACVYSSELIEEGFLCPSIVPFGFLLVGGGVACVDSQQMPDPLIQALDDLGLQPNEPGCFAADPADICFYTEPTTSTGAFDLAGANILSYRAGGGLGFCVDSLLDFTVDLSTGAATIGYLVPGDAATDNCLTMPPDCEVRAETTLTLDATQLQQVKDLYGDVPAPQCQQNGPAVCDPCVIETLTVDEASVDTFCCAETAIDFGPSVVAVADYLRSLIPVTTAAFSNPDSFQLMTYTTGGGLGYCIEADAIVQATFTRQQDGSLAAEGETASGPRSAISAVATRRQALAWRLMTS